MRLNLHCLAFKQCLLTALGVGLVFGLIFFVLRSQAAAQVSEMLIRQGQHAGESGVARMEQIFQESVRIGERTVARLEKETPERGSRPAFLKEMLEQARTGRPEIAALVIAYEPRGGHGQMLLSRYADGRIETIQGEDYLDKPWYADTRKQLRGMWREPFIGDFIREPIAIYTLPFFETGANGERKFAGVVCVDLSLAFLRDAVAAMPLKDSGYGFILSGSGRIITHPNRELTLLSSSSAAHFAPSALRREIRKQKSGVFIGRAFEHTEACVYFQPLRSSGWTFGIVFPAKEFFARRQIFDFTFWSVGLAGFSVMLLVVVWIAIRAGRPLNMLAEVASEIGQGNFDVPIPPVSRKDEIGMFAAAFNQMRLSLAAHVENLRNVTAAKERIEGELRVAQEIQRGILPKILPPFPKCEAFEIDAFLTPAREVGGDLYDFFLLSPTKICLVIGDVSGKGVPASLFMAITQTLHRGFTRETEPDPQALVAQMNRALCDNNSADLFVTYFFAVLDLSTGVMTYCNAGHNPFYVLKHDGTSSAPGERHGIPLGVRPNRPYGRSELRLEENDTLFLYTDGIPEAKNGAGAFFGDHRLAEVLANAAAKQLSPKEITRSVREQLALFVDGAEQFDDIAAVCLKILKKPGSTGESTS